MTNFWMQWALRLSKSFFISRRGTRIQVWEGSR
jgi:hypothetical protein